MAPSPADDEPPAATDTLEVRPFRATTYAVHDPDHLARVSSPAYDLVSAEGRARLAAADPHNVVRLILPELDGPPPASRAAPSSCAPSTLPGSSTPTCASTPRPRWYLRW